VPSRVVCVDEGKKSLPSLLVESVAKWYLFSLLREMEDGGDDVQGGIGGGGGGDDDGDCARDPVV
jgi:hypothetical protein